MMKDSPGAEDKKTDALSHLSLGKTSSYREYYAPELLQAVPRSLNRAELQLPNGLPFHGADRWNGYELSWLNNKGKPQIAILQALVPASSTNLIESKSFKLYLNSFNQSKIESLHTLQSTLCKDLSACAGEHVQLRLFSPNQFSELQLATWESQCIDELDIDVDSYQLDPSYLRAQGALVSETLSSHLLKSNCLITNQPDWASILIRYHGPAIDREGLLRYLISFRQHNEFHEQCVERIFCDLMEFCRPQQLSVYARYTRRGGLDINPFRSNFESIYPEQRLPRQ